MNDIFFILWFFLPAGIANTAPIFVSHMPVLKQWNYPLDCYKEFHGKRIFGDHKTIRGIVAGMIVGGVVSVLEHYIYLHWQPVHRFIPSSFNTINPILFGICSGVGALIGDAVKSFLKRQRGIASGNTWFPFDQTDYIIGGVLCTLPFYILSIYQYVLLFVVWFVLHPLSTIIGFTLKLKRRPW